MDIHSDPQTVCFKKKKSPTSVFGVIKQTYLPHTLLFSQLFLLPNPRLCSWCLYVWEIWGKWSKAGPGPHPHMRAHLHMHTWICIFLLNREKKASWQTWCGNGGTYQACVWKSKCIKISKSWAKKMDPGALRRPRPALRLLQYSTRVNWFEAFSQPSPKPWQRSTVSLNARTHIHTLNLKKKHITLEFTNTYRSMF